MASEKHRPAAALCCTITLVLVFIVLGGVQASTIPQRHLQQQDASSVEYQHKVPLGKDLVTPPTLKEAFPYLGVLEAACPTSHSTPLVVAMAAKTEPFKVCPFIRSWHMHSPTTHVIILTDSVVQRAAIMGSLHSVSNVHVLVVGTKPPKGTEWHMWRYFLYNWVLETCARKGPLPPVMVSDVRDALALSDVWSHPMVTQAVTDQYAIFALEGNVGDNGVMKTARAVDGGWSQAGVQSCFHGLDPAVTHTESLLEYGYTCSGVTVGGGDAMLNYTRAMTYAMLHMSTAACWSFHGGDQFVHMWLLMLNLNATETWATAVLERHPLLRVRSVGAKNGEGPVYTAALGLPIHIDMLGGITVRRHNWTYSPSYMHQYDRDTMVGREVFLLYPCSLTPISLRLQYWHWHQRLKFSHQIAIAAVLFTVCVVVTTLGVLHLTVGLAAVKQLLMKHRPLGIGIGIGGEGRPPRPRSG